MDSLEGKEMVATTRASLHRRFITQRGFSVARPLDYLSSKLQRSRLQTGVFLERFTSRGWSPPDMEKSSDSDMKNDQGVALLATPLLFGGIFKNCTKCGPKCVCDFFACKFKALLFRGVVPYEYMII